MEKHQKNITKDLARYLQSKFIGSGTYSEVFEGIDTITNEKVAMKKIRLSKDEGIPGTALREISILRNLKHVNILTLKSVIHTDKILVMVFEFVDYDLKEYIAHHPHNTIDLIKQLCDGLSYIHNKMIVHRDLKPQNILVNKKGILKIADFGLARSMQMEMNTYANEVITLWYRPPELLKGATAYGTYIDIWSLGCIIVEMLSNQVLFKGTNNENQLKLISKYKTKFDFKELISTKVGKIQSFLMGIILGCLCIDVAERVTADEILFYLKSIGY
ncbi:putative cell division protein kinase [Astathelohania contejeani]|uniref:Cell division protein kinase n=1 Tax=Astathelohania contejeani TaxID=164912 RepID=A0ABQ7I267_9MICR|nr:putative cell division protein kinase [Thelohania contejeani]